MRKAAGGLLLVLVLALAACHPAFKPETERLMAPEGTLAFPFKNAFVATVVGTAAADRVVLPKDIPIQQRTLPVVEDRVVPRVLWYENRFRYSIAAQSGKAPLVFIVAGTNAGYSTRLSTYLQQLFFTAGFHAVSLSSPTFPNFMVTGSTTSVPGWTAQDAADLYQIMQRVLADVRPRVEISDVSLTGYSLGAWHSAFVAALDQKQQAIGFRKVLLINPPVSLYRSSRVLDEMLVKNLPGGIDNLDAFVRNVVERLAELYRQNQGVTFSHDMLLDAYDALRPTEEQLAAVIGAVFRLASANIAFTADVMSQSGYLVPVGRELRISTSLTPFFDAGMRRGFIQYFEELLYPYYQRRYPTLTRQQIIAAASLESIEPFLAQAPNVGLVTSKDDIILAPGDIAFMQRTFGERATFFDNGGHCGNMMDAHVAAAYLRFMMQ
ncbi:MAG: alpha/beta fold hydrolase [Rhodospirillales bacterium]